MNRVLVLILSFIILLSALSGVCFAGSGYETFTVYNDFNTKQDAFGFTDVSSSSSLSYVTDDEEHQKALKFTSETTHSVYTRLEKPVTDGGFLISFDMKFEDTKSQHLFLRFVSKDVGSKVGAISHNDSFLTFAVKGGGFDYFPGMDVNNWWYVSGNPVKFQVNKWHHIDIFADMFERKLYYYLDNKLYATDKMKSEFSGIHGFYLTSYDLEDGPTVFYLDNWAFMETEYENIKPLLKSGHDAPLRIKSPIKISLDEMPFGHNFYDASNVPMSLKLENAVKTATTADVVYKIVDEYNRTVWIKNDIINIDAGGSIEKKVVTTPNTYGRLRFKVEITDKETGDQSFFDTPIAVIRAAQPNKRAAVHTLFNNDNCPASNITPMIETFERAGFSARRTNYAWNHVETEPGVIKIQGKPAIEINATPNIKMEELCTLSFGNEIYSGLAPNGSPSIMPASDTELEAWGRYCYEITKLTKHRTKYYEIWNEPNLIPNFNPTGVGPEGYAKLVKVAYENIKKANPDAVVVGMSQSNYGTDFIGAVLDAGGGDYMDAISFHPYMWTQGPEAGQMDFIKTLRDFVDAKGYPHLSFIVTEVGWQETVGEDEQGIYQVQMFILNEVYGGLVDTFHIYRYVEEDKLIGNEGFGLLDGIYREVPYMARKNLIGQANFNHIMNEVEFKETKISAEGLPLYNFKLNDGRDAIVTWNSLGGKKDLSLYLGCSSITVSDMYGTERVYTSDDGNYTISIDKFPHYIMGDFSKVEDSGKEFYADKASLDIVSGSKAEINLTSRKGDDFEVTALTGEELNIVEVVPFDNGKAKIIISADEDFDGTEGVEVVVSKQGKTYYRVLVDVTAIEPITVKSYVEFHSGNRWRFSIDVSNHLYDGEIGGKIVVDEPADFSKWVPERKMKAVRGGTTETVKVPVPDFLGTKDTEFVGKLIMENGTEIDLSRTLSFKGIPYMRKEPTYDGVIEKGEWNTQYALPLGDGVDGCNNVNLAGNPYHGNNDLKGTIYCGWDRKNFYMAAEIYDNMYEIHEKDIWAGDSIQFAVSLEKTRNAPRTEITFGFTKKSKEPALVRVSNLAPPTDGSRFIHELQIVNYPQEDGTHKTVYEMSIPWAEMYPAGFDISDHSRILLSILVNDRDGNTRESYLEIGSGIGGLKSAEHHLEYNLLK